METEIYKIDDNYRIVEDVICRKKGQIVKINGSNHVTGVGYQYIYYLCHGSKKLSNVSFLRSHDFKDEAYQKMKVEYVKILLNHFIKLFNKFVENTFSNVAVQAQG